MEKDSIAYFTGTLLDNELLNDPKNKYSYRSAHSVFVSSSRQVHLSPSYDMDRIKPYFTEMFEQGIEQLTANEII